MKIIVGKNIRISDANTDIVNYISKELVLQNPKFEENLRLGYSNYGTQAKLYYFIKNGNDFIIPFGCLQDIWKLYPFKDSYEINFAEQREISYESIIDLYDYQKVAQKSILELRNGIVVMPCGSGKTQTGLDTIAKIGGRALWITHTMDLLNQSYDRAKANFENIGLGKITGGKIDIGTHITFATVQTLYKMNLSEYQNEWDIIVIDECHKVVGTPASAGMFYKTIDSLSARYKIGLTATPYRSAKGTEKAMFFLIGQVICEIPQSVVKTMKARIKKVTTKFQITGDCQKGDGTLDYSKMTNNLGADEKRNELIVSYLNDNKDHYCLILSDRVAHLRELCNRVGGVMLLDEKLSPKLQKETRLKVLDKLRNREEHFLFATYSLAKEGLDIKNMDRLFLTMPRKDKATIIQSVGRIERELDGKDTPIVYDFVDDTGFHNNQWRTRRAIYKKNGNEIIEY